MSAGMSGYRVSTPPLGNRRAILSGIVALSLIITGLIASGASARAQLIQRPVAIQNARILTMDGRVIENGTLVIKGQKIVTLAPGSKAPMLARKIDARGGTITPGLIDAHSALGGSPRGGSAIHRAEDAFNRYDTAHLTEALRHGVTAIYLSPGTSGTGAIIRLAPESPGAKPLGKVLQSEAALCVSLSSSSSPIARLKVLAGLRKQFDGALAYRRSLEDYDEALTKYEKELKEWAAKRAKEAAKKKAEEKKASSEKESAAAEPAKDDKPAEKKEDEKKEDEKKDEKKDEGDGRPKKPTRPGRNPRSDIVLKALDREIPVRMAADRNEDIINALELAEEFSLDLILEGATEAHLVVDQLADADVLVVLRNMARPGIQDDKLYRQSVDTPPADNAPSDDEVIIYRRSGTSQPSSSRGGTNYRSIHDLGAVLTKAGVPWIVGGGTANETSARFILQNAQLAVGRGGGVDPLKMVTADAADAIKAGDRIGRLRPGLMADLVLWSGDPCDPASTVRQVYVGGTLMYQAVEDAEKGERE